MMSRGADAKSVISLMEFVFMVKPRPPDTHEAESASKKIEMTSGGSDLS